MAMESNIAVLTSLRGFYQDIIDSDSFQQISATPTFSAPSTAPQMPMRNPFVPSSPATAIGTEFTKDIATLIESLKLQVLRASHLSQMMSSRKELVSNIR